MRIRNAPPWFLRSTPSSLTGFGIRIATVPYFYVDWGERCVFHIRFQLEETANYVPGVWDKFGDAAVETIVVFKVPLS